MKLNLNNDVNREDDSTESLVICSSEEQFDIVLDLVKTHTDKSIA